MPNANCPNTNLHPTRSYYKAPKLLEEGMIAVVSLRACSFMYNAFLVFENISVAALPVCRFAAKVGLVTAANYMVSPVGASCFAVLPLPLQVLTAGILASYRTSSVPYALGVSLMSVCNGTFIQGLLAWSFFIK